jgi:hypothetical protein
MRAAILGMILDKRISRGSFGSRSGVLQPRHGRARVRSVSYCVTCALSPGLTKFSAHRPRVLI